MKIKGEKRIFGGILSIASALLLCFGCSLSFADEDNYSSEKAVPVETAGRSEMMRTPTVEKAESLPAADEAAAEELSLFVEEDPGIYTYEDMEEDICSIAAAYEEVAADSLGKTMDGREIYHILIGREDAPYHVLITASIHAREYITTQLVMKQTAEFLKNDQLKENYLDSVAVHVVPMVNPDGVSISQFGLDGIRTQEAKDYIRNVVMAADGSDGSGNYFSRWKANAHGVDLNRNFDALWDSYAGSGHPSSDHYKGEAPGCEPEAAALISLTEKYPSRGQSVTIPRAALSTGTLARLVR